MGLRFVSMAWLRHLSFCAPLATFAACASFEGSAGAPAPPTDAGPFRLLLEDDFERADIPGGKWQLAVTAPASLTLPTSFATSPTRSLRVQVAGTDTRGEGRIHAALGGRQRGIRCKAQVYPVTLSSRSVTSLFRIEAQTNVASELAGWEMYLSLGPGGTQLFVVETESGDQPNGRNQTAAAIPLNSWSEIGVEVAFDDKLVTVTRAGAPLLSLSLTKQLLETNAFDFWVGVSSQNGPTDYYVDDVQCWVR
jgi:hypothetical protein